MSLFSFLHTRIIKEASNSFCLVWMFYSSYTQLFIYFLLLVNFGLKVFLSVKCTLGWLDTPVSFIATIWAKPSVITKCRSIQVSMIQRTMLMTSNSWMINLISYFAFDIIWCIVFGLVSVVGCIVPVLRYEYAYFYCKWCSIC